jgi:hypothetical protein
MKKKPHPRELNRIQVDNIITKWQAKGFALKSFFWQQY